MFTIVEEYILLSQKERQLHLDLNSKCIEIGGGSSNFRGLLAYFLKTTLHRGL